MTKQRQIACPFCESWTWFEDSPEGRDYQRKHIELRHWTPLETARITDAIRSLLIDVPEIDLTDLSDFVVVEMEEINEIVVHDFEETATGFRIDLAGYGSDWTEVADAERMILDCVQSMRESYRPGVVS